MIPSGKWTKDWESAFPPNREPEVSHEIIEIFRAFWDWANLEDKRKSTQRIYSDALHALGGYLVEEIKNGERPSETTRDFLRGYIDSGDGPLIHPDNEAWQDEIDRVCRKLCKYIDVEN
jgi:hypothetical protein